MQTAHAGNIWNVSNPFSSQYWNSGMMKEEGTKAKVMCGSHPTTMGIFSLPAQPPPARVLHAADGWSSNVLDLINFDVNGRIRKQQKWTSKTRTMKVLHGLLAVMHNLGKRNGSAQ
jgi:hypothetical protein